MMEKHNQNLLEVLRLTQTMLDLAERGDEERVDTGCGVLYGTLRDAAFKIRRLALDERDVHIAMEMWDGEGPLHHEQKLASNEGECVDFSLASLVTK
ncbi:MAG: hypothetical protein V2A56_04555 [bacterium]